MQTTMGVGAGAESRAQFPSESSTHPRGVGPVVPATEHLQSRLKAPGFHLNYSSQGVREVDNDNKNKSHTLYSEISF